MPLFLDSPDQAGEPGVFPIEQATPNIIEGVPNGYVGLACRTEWGPVAGKSGGVAVKPNSAGDMIKTFFPAGSAHTSTGYYAIMRRRGLPLYISRALGGQEGLLPPDPPILATAGTPGAVTYQYRIVAKNAVGDSQGSAIAKIATGHAVLDVTNYVTLAWAAVVGATSYDIYLVASAGNVTLGKLATQAGVTYNHQGANGSPASAAPTANTSGWKTAVCYLLDSGGYAVGKLIAKYPAAWPNTVFVATVAAASNGDADMADVTVTASDAVTGTTNEPYPNTDFQNVNVGGVILPDVDNSVLLGSAARVGTRGTRPANGTYTFVGGSDGSAIASGDYEDAIDQLALQSDIRVICADDCGDTARAAVNAALKAQAEDLTDRVAVVQATPDDFASVTTDVASYRGDRVFYQGKMVNVLNDAGDPVLTPFATFVAGALAQLEPQQSHAMHDELATKYYTGIYSIDTTDGWSSADPTVRATALTQGIGLPIRLTDGRYASLHDRVTLQTANKRYGVTRRIKDFLGLSLKAGLDVFVNAPNVGSKQRDAAMATQRLLNDQQTKERLTAVGQVDIKTPNTTTTAALGEFYLGIEARSPAPMEKIFPLIKIGPTVEITFQ